MKHYIFEGKINVEPVDKLLNFLSVTEEKVLVYIDTPGGENSLTDYLLHYLNLNKDRIILMSGNEITSNGLWLFYYFEGEKIISESTISMIHQSWKNIPTYDLKDRDSDGYKDLKKLNRINEKSLNILTPYLTKKEIKEYKKGCNIYLDSDRIRQIVLKNE